VPIVRENTHSGAKLFVFGLWMDGIMERRQFLNLLLSSTGTAFVAGRPLSLLGADPTKIASAVSNSKLKAPVKICLQCEGLLEKYDDYEVVFIKRELVGRKMSEAVMKVKFREDPLSVYMLFGKPFEGREVIYVEGQNNNELLVHETGLKGLAGTLSLDPTGSMAMKDNHHPISNFGMKNMMSELALLWANEAHIPNVDVKFYPKAKIGELECKAIEVTHPKPVLGVDFHITRLYLNAETHIPVRLQHYKFPRKTGGEPILYEEYTYLEFKPNQGYQDIDFDIRNPNYNF